jgi:hypothetical protein
MVEGPGLALNQGTSTPEIPNDYSLIATLPQGVASFHLDKLIPDLRFNDGTLVVSPCNSPEQVPITLGAFRSIIARTTSSM